MSLVQAEINLCNMSLAKLGANRITLDNQGSPEGIQCNLHYAQARDALVRLYPWPFACARAELVEDSSTPDFEWSVQFDLPDDCLRVLSNYTIDDTFEMSDRYTIEGSLLLTNEATASILYIRQVTDPAEFDPLFVEMLVLELALKMLYPLAGVSAVTLQLHQQISKELEVLIARAKAIGSDEVNVSGRSGWNYARYGTGLV